MLKLLDIIYEGAYDAQGVGDKAYEKFHIPTDVPNLKTLAELQRQENGKPVARVGKDGTYIFLNPRSLKYFGRSARGIADEHGNLYMAQKDGEFDHNDILDVLHLSIYRGDFYARLVRLGNGNKLHDVTDYGDYDDYIKQYTHIMHAIRKKNPHLIILSSL